jgi:hypothetical protein
MECISLITHREDERGVLNEGWSLTSKDICVGGMHPNTVRRELKKLASLGYINLKRRKHGYRIEVNLRRVFVLKSNNILSLIPQSNNILSLSEGSGANQVGELVPQSNKNLSLSQPSERKGVMAKNRGRKPTRDNIISNIQELHLLLEKELLSKRGRVVDFEEGWRGSVVEDDKQRQNPIAKYMDLFKTEKMRGNGKKLLPQKELRLLSELWILSQGKGVYDGEPIHCRPEDVMASIEAVYNIMSRKNIYKPFKNHNYLKQVVMSQAARRANRGIPQPRDGSHDSSLANESGFIVWRE